MVKKYNRRTFLEFLGKGTVGLVVVPSLAYGCNNDEPTAKHGQKPKKFPFTPISPSLDDELILADGFDFEVLIKWGDKINQSDYFGFNNDFTMFIPFENNMEEGYLWVNHEYTDSLFISGRTSQDIPTKEQVDNEMYNVGGSILHIKRKGRHWELVSNSPKNKRLSAHTLIPVNWDEAIAGKTTVMGTLANCSGGLTPWKTILTCEENYDSCFGETVCDDEGVLVHFEGSKQWEKHYPENKPEHYGWVVEVDPKTGDAQKHIALGRCCHECATVKELDDKRIVVYTGDDGNDRCLYKFVSSEPGSLKNGTLYVANLEEKKWVPVVYDKHPILQEKFKNQTEVLIRLREAAPLIGGTPLDRPEDIEIDPVNGNVLIALTNNVAKDNYFGQILKITESEGYDGLSFEYDTYLAGGEETGFACPDNMAFDPVGNLWFTSDMSGSVINTEPYTSFKNNGLFFVPRSGEKAGEVLQVASAPVDAEFTGPCFSPDGTTLFLSVQHPGEYSTSIDELSSHWPDGNSLFPRPAVVTITGKSLKKIMKGEI